MAIVLLPGENKTLHEPAADKMRRLPQVQRLLELPQAQPLREAFPHGAVVAAIRTALEEARAGLRQPDGPAAPDAAALLARAKTVLDAQEAPVVGRVINATGIILHTNLGRAPLPEAAIAAIAAAAGGYCNLEYDLASGARGSRTQGIEPLLQELTGAEASLAVNNNAAAVLLALSALAGGGEVIVSRGELVEIGGSFRIPDIMARARARLVEVGTTNRTHPRDYAEAIGPRTALLMKVHCSNYAVTGFTASVPDAEIAAIGDARGVPLVVDLGSGSLVNLARWGLPREVTVRETVAAGAGVVTFSGDKLLGGPQAGLIVGRRELVARIRKSPLKRALRVGKLTLAALEPVLALYRAPELLPQRLPALRLLTRPQGAMLAQAQRLLGPVQAALGELCAVQAAAMLSQIGSGALPVDLLPSAGLALRPGARRAGRTLARLEAALRELPRPVIGRVGEGALWLDLRCLEEADEPAFVAQLPALARTLPA